MTTYDYPTIFSSQDETHVEPSLMSSFDHLCRFNSGPDLLKACVAWLRHVHLEHLRPKSAYWFFRRDYCRKHCDRSRIKAKWTSLSTAELAKWNRLSEEDWDSLIPRIQDYIRAQQVDPEPEPTLPALPEPTLPALPEPVVPKVDVASIVNMLNAKAREARLEALTNHRKRIKPVFKPVPIYESQNKGRRRLPSFLR